MMRSIAATLSLLALEACVHEQVLEPAAGASLAPGRPVSANAPSSASSRPAEWDYDRFANWPERLPTQEMLPEALPEGVVENGGSVAGVIYFESVTGRESAADLEMTLVDPNDGQTFGRVAIPFQVRKQAADEEQYLAAALAERQAPR